MDRLNVQIIFPPIIIGVIIFSLIFGFLFCWPKYPELKSLQKNIKIKQDELSWQKEYFIKLSQIKNELKNYETEFSKINTALPKDNSVPALLNFIQIAASQSGLVLKAISPTAASPSLFNPDIKETQLSFSLDGSYSSFKNFLFVLENSARFIDVEDISFSSPKEKDIFTFNIKIKTYSY